jgi:hypothetical protein
MKIVPVANLKIKMKTIKDNLKNGSKIFSPGGALCPACCALQFVAAGRPAIATTGTKEIR